MIDATEERRRLYRMTLAFAGKAGKRFNAIKECLPEGARNDLLWASGSQAEVIKYCGESDPDILLLDIDLCGDQTIDLLHQIRLFLDCPILLLTTSLQQQRSLVFRGLGSGAFDALELPDPVGEVGLSAMLQKMHRIARVTIRERRHLDALQKIQRVQGSRDTMIAIGTSTGGPSAVVELLSALPKEFAAAIVVILHIDVQFSQSMADWMNAVTPMPLRLACEGNQPKVGEILLAGTNEHLTMTAKGTLHYTTDPVDNPYRPSADVFFHSLVQHWKGEAVGVLLTGMGHDGADGLLAMRNHGWITIAQDEQSSTIYGMPKAAAQMNAAKQIMPLDSIGPELICLIDGDEGKVHAPSASVQGGNRAK